MNDNASEMQRLRDLTAQLREHLENLPRAPNDKAWRDAQAKLFAAEVKLLALEVLKDAGPNKREPD